MNPGIIEIDKTSELFPQSLLEIGDDCTEQNNYKNRNKIGTNSFPIFAR